MDQSAIKWDGLAYGRCPALSLTVPASTCVALAGGGSLSCSLSLHAQFRRQSRITTHLGISWATRNPSGAAFKFRKWRLHLSATFKGLFELGHLCCTEWPINAADERCHWIETQHICLRQCWTEKRSKIRMRIGSVFQALSRKMKRAMLRSPFFCWTDKLMFAN